MARVSIGRRSLALLLALILAGVAALALTFWVRGIEDRALEGLEATEVFVAKDFIPQGTRAEVAIGRGLIDTETVPAKVRATGAITSLSDIEGRLASVTIVPGEQILTFRFVLPEDAAGLLNIPDDRQALSIQVDIPSGVAGFIQPGDRISIIAHLTFDAARQAVLAGQVPLSAIVPIAETDNQEARTIIVVKMLLQNIEVLTAGQRVVTTNAEGQDTADVRQESGNVLLTLALTPAEAEILTYIIFEGDTYFTLLPDGQEPVTTTGRTQDNILLP